MPYSIGFDERRHILRLRLRGFWAPTTFARFDAEFRARVQAVVRDHSHFDTFIDATGFQVQSPEIAQGFGVLKRMSDAASPGRRSALIVDSALSRMQVRRTVNDDAFRFFDNEAEAIAWLATPPD